MLNYQRVSIAVDLTLYLSYHPLPPNIRPSANRNLLEKAIGQPSLLTDYKMRSGEAAARSHVRMMSKHVHLKHAITYFNKLRHAIAD